MSPELENMLLAYLGELMYREEQENDWMGKDAISAKINAVNVLLDIPGKRVTWYEKLAKELKTIKSE
jgi:hypothetical protein